MTCHSTNVQIDDDDDTSGVHEQVGIVRVLFLAVYYAYFVFCNIGNHFYHKPISSKSAKQHDWPRRYQVVMKLKAHVSTFQSKCLLIMSIKR